jgi:hypothetical protein
MKNEKYEREGRLKVKVHILFCIDNSLWEIRLGTVKIMGIHTSVISIIIFYEAFKYGDDMKFCRYDATNNEPLGPEFCNFVQCPILVNSLTFYLSVCVSPLKTSWTKWFKFMTN